MAKKVENNDKVIAPDVLDINEATIMIKTEINNPSEDHILLVPNGYIARVYENNTCTKEILKPTKDKLSSFVGSMNSNISILFIKNAPLTEMSWGIGNLPINYKIKDGIEIKVGANGQFLAKIIDYDLFFDSLERGPGKVSLAEVTSRLVSGFRIISSKILMDLFNEAEGIIFNAEFLIDELDRRMNRFMCDKTFDEIPGAIFKTITTAGIGVCKDDIQYFRNNYFENKSSSVKVVSK